MKGRQWSRLLFACAPLAGLYSIDARARGLSRWELREDWACVCASRSRETRVDALSLRPSLPPHRPLDASGAGVIFDSLPCNDETTMAIEMCASAPLSAGPPLSNQNPKFDLKMPV